MLRVGLTGGLGSGKSTAAALLRQLGAHVIEADQLGRELMEPGQPVYDRIVRTFGPQVVLPDGRLNRPRLAELAFREGRLHDLNAIVHPAVIAAQQRWSQDVFARDPRAVAVVESALIFEVERDARARGESAEASAGDRSSSLGWLTGVPGDRSSSPGWLADWRKRFDRILVLTAPDHVKIERYVARTHPAADRSSPEWDEAVADARIRLARQMPDAEKAAQADFVIENTGDLAALRHRITLIWAQLQAESNKNAGSGSLK